MNLKPKSDEIALGLFNSTEIAQAVAMCQTHTRCRRFKDDVP